MEELIKNVIKKARKVFCYSYPEIVKCSAKIDIRYDDKKDALYLNSVSFMEPYSGERLLINDKNVSHYSGDHTCNWKCISSHKSFDNFIKEE